MVNILKRWYEGKFVIMEFANDPDSCIIILPGVRREYHWTARLARSVVRFYILNWQWFWTMAASIAATIAGFLATK